MNVLQALIKDAINTDFSTYKKPIFSLKNKVVMVSLDWLRVMFNKTDKAIFMLVLSRNNKLPFVYPLLPVNINRFLEVSLERFAFLTNLY